MYDGPFVYDWDALNRLVRVERDDGVSTLTTIAENEWDTKNRRVYRWCDDSVSGVDEALVFVHAGGQIIEEWNVDGTTALKRRWVFGGSGDRLFRRVDSTDFVLLEKLNGSIVSQVDPSRKLVAYWDDKAYGLVESEEALGSLFFNKGNIVAVDAAAGHYFAFGMRMDLDSFAGVADSSPFVFDCFSGRERNPIEALHIRGFDIGIILQQGDSSIPPDNPADDDVDHDGTKFGDLVVASGTLKERPMHIVGLQIVPGGLPRSSRCCFTSFVARLGFKTPKGGRPSPITGAIKAHGKRSYKWSTGSAMNHWDWWPEVRASETKNPCHAGSFGRISKLGPPNVPAGNYIAFYDTPSMYWTPAFAPAFKAGAERIDSNFFQDVYFGCEKNGTIKRVSIHLHQVFRLSNGIIQKGKAVIKREFGDGRAFDSQVKALEAAVPLAGRKPKIALNGKRPGQQTTKAWGPKHGP